MSTIVLALMKYSLGGTMMKQKELLVKFPCYVASVELLNLSMTQFPDVDSRKNEIFP